MNAQAGYLLFAVFGLAAFDAGAATTYVGSWHNTTFGSSGDATIVIDRVGDDWTASIDLDGNVLGGADPAAVLVSGTFSPTGSSVFAIDDHPAYGDISGSISGGVLVEASMTDLPNALITGVEVSGCIGNTGIACLAGGIELDYQVFFASGFGLPPFAEGTITASPVVVPLPAMAPLFALALVSLPRRRLARVQRKVLSRQHHASRSAVAACDSDGPAPIFRRVKQPAIRDASCEYKCLAIAGRVRHV